MEFLGPGLSATDTVIDKYFDKIPNKAFQKNTYIPGRRSRPSPRPESEDSNQDQNQSQNQSQSQNRNSNRGRNQGLDENQGNNQESSSRASSEADYEHISHPNREQRMISTADAPRYSGEGSDYYPRQSQPQQSNTPPRYSHLPPYQRQQYMPSPPPSQYQSSRRNRDRDYYYNDDDAYYSDSHRSAAAAPSNRRPRFQQRSSSYDGPSSRADYGTEKGSRSGGNGQLVSHRRNDSGSSQDTSREHKGRKDKLKEELGDIFTKSPQGVAGGAVGAVVGGWVAHKAQTAYGRDLKKHEKSNAVWTLLGATIGGLAVNAVVDKYQVGKAKTEEKEVEWDDKYGNEDRGGDRGGERRRQNDRGRGWDRERDRGYGSD